MTKKQKSAPDIASLTDAIDLFTKQADRGTALVVAASLDGSLEALLRAQFRPETVLADELLGSEDPLEHFRSDQAVLLAGFD